MDNVALNKDKPFDQGFQPDFPMQIGSELNFFLPSTQMLITLAALGEFESLESWYIMGGIGFNLLI